MSLYLLRHSHDPCDCAASYAAWRGTASPLRGREAVRTCLHGDHTVFWVAEAADALAALGLLPPYVAARTEAVPIRRVVTP